MCRVYGLCRRVTKFAVSPGTVLKLFVDDILVFRPLFSVEDAALLQNDLDTIAR